MISYYSIFLFLSICLLFSQKESNNTIWPPLLILSLFAGLRGASSGDYCNYYNIISATKSLYDIYIIYLDQTITGLQDYGFIFLISIIKIFITNSVLVFLSIAILAVGINLYSLRKLSPMFYGSVIIYFSHAFIYKEMAQMRHGLASAFLLMTIVLLYEKKFFQYLAFYLFAVSNHISAIVGISFIFIKKYSIKRYIALLTIIIFIILVYYNIDLLIIQFIESFNLLPERYFLYKGTVTKGSTIGIITNITTVKHLLIFMVCFFYFNQLSNKFGSLFELLFGIYCLGIVWLILFNSYSILAARVATFFTIVEIILVPMIAIYLTNRKFAQIIIIFYALTHLSYNIFMTQEVKYKGLIFSDTTDKCVIQRF
jgi:hypothetical protein